MHQDDMGTVGVEGQDAQVVEKAGHAPPLRGCPQLLWNKAASWSVALSKNRLTQGSCADPDFQSSFTKCEGAELKARPPVHKELVLGPGDL